MLQHYPRFEAMEVSCKMCNKYVACDLHQLKTDDHLQDFWPLMQAGWKVWPFVSLLNFTVVPLERRTLVGSLFGLVWGIYMSMLAAQ